MEGLLIFCILIAAGFTYTGVKLMRLAVRRRKPPVPPAQTANPSGIAYAYGKAARTPGKLARSLLFGAGAWLIAAPWLFLHWLLSGGLSLGIGSKGRVLRIRSRAQLAEPARGNEWAGEAVALRGTLSAADRAALGELWLLTARMEHASVAAFSQLGLHLGALGAPAHLLEATHRAALDEIRHARACFAIVHALTGEPHSAGPIPALASARSSSIDHTRLALGSLIDGCLAEGIAADVAAHGAEPPPNPPSAPRSP